MPHTRSHLLFHFRAALLYLARGLYSLLLAPSPSPRLPLHLSSCTPRYIVDRLLALMLILVVSILVVRSMRS